MAQLTTQTHNRPRILDWLELARPEHLFSAISNSWLLVLMSAHIEPTSHQNPALMEMPLWARLLIATLIPAGLGIFGIGFNDVLDLKHDRTFRPASPLAAGRVSVATAASLAVAFLLIAFGAATFLGRYSQFLCVLTAGAILFFNICGKFLPATGLISMGLIRIMTMFICVPRMGFTWPACMTMAHIIICMALVYAIQGRRPRMRGSDLGQLAAGTLFWAVLLVLFMILRQTLLLHDHPHIWVGPLIAMGVFVLVSIVYLKKRLPDLRARRQTAQRFQQMAMLWLIVYDMSWMLSLKQNTEALLIAAVGIVALVIVTYISVQRHMSHESGQYRVREG
jgi:4-hydroxybenzoate polyprenyltransferase